MVLNFYCAGDHAADFASFYSKLNFRIAELEVKTFGSIK